MATDKNLNELLKWSIEAANPSTDANGAPRDPAKGLTPELLSSIMGGPSDAELMVAAMQMLTSKDPADTLDAKLTAFDNLEQLIESLDNANLLSNLGLWTPLLDLLAHDEPEMRRMAAWCVGTAVQNNEPSQERLVALGGIEKLVAIALGERLAPASGSGTETAPASTSEAETKDVRRKAAYALSSAVRNYQPAMDTCVRAVRAKGGDEAVSVTPEKVDASDMDAVDGVINWLKEKATNA